MLVIDGESDGLSVNDIVGLFEGDFDGICDGYDVGESVGMSEGVFDGKFVGAAEGTFDGIFVGLSVGCTLGIPDGSIVGSVDGEFVGLIDGYIVGGSVDGACVGISDGDSVGFALNWRGIFRGHVPLHKNEFEDIVLIVPKSWQLEVLKQSNEQSPVPQRIFMSVLHASVPAHLIVTSVAFNALIVVPSAHDVLDVHNIWHGSPDRQLFVYTMVKSWSWCDEQWQYIL